MTHWETFIQRAMIVALVLLFAFAVGLTLTSCNTIPLPDAPSWTGKVFTRHKHAPYNGCSDKVPKITQFWGDQVGLDPYEYFESQSYCTEDHKLYPRDGAQGNRDEAKKIKGRMRR